MGRGGAAGPRINRITSRDDFLGFPCVALVAPRERDWVDSGELESVKVRFVGGDPFQPPAAETQDEERFVRSFGFDTIRVRLTRK